MWETTKKHLLKDTSQAFFAGTTGWTMMPSIGLGGAREESVQWHPTPVLLPGKSHGLRSLVGYSLWGRKESDTTETSLHFTLCHVLLGQAVWHVGSQFPDQGSDPCPLHWNRLHHWPTCEVPNCVCCEEKMTSWKNIWPNAWLLISPPTWQLEAFEL